MKKISKFLGLFLLGVACILALASCGSKTTIVLNKGLQNESTITGTLYVQTGYTEYDKGREIQVKPTYRYILLCDDSEHTVYSGNGAKTEYIRFKKSNDMTYKYYEDDIIFVGSNGYLMKGDYLIDPSTLIAMWKKLDKTL